MSAPLPIIDISPFLAPPSPSNASARAATAAAIHQACASYGFLYVKGTGLSATEMEAPLEVAREFFGRPMEEKKELRIRTGDGARGYQLLGENVTQYKADHHEGWDAYCPVTPEDPTKLLRGPNQWPPTPATFRPIMEDWVEKMKVLGLALLEATAMGLGLTDEEWNEFKRLTEESFWVMRAIAYPPLPPDAPGISCGVHADYGNFTLLHADSTQGALQVFLVEEDGKEECNGRKGRWINADPIPDTFVVNIGEMWEIWSNGLYKATLHRVIHKGTNLRVSLPFFSEPNFDALIEPLPAALRLQSKLAGKEVGAAKKPCVYGDFLTSKVSGNFSLTDTK
ncbi:oxoglutarate/iron-dependent oxygenase [Pseudohyphozyma bogoriensis]|nr:oxoglutarate/iron-dependent oxygenase [Pseudohyphozyma bogoriensis]